MTDFERARRAMVDNQLLTSGITDRRILAAMGAVPRELFVPDSRQALAYVDVSHPLAGSSGRALAAPAPFARLVQLAEIEAGDRVLDVGAGTGYSSAVLARLARDVTALEGDVELARAARELLPAVGAGNASVLEAPVDAGAPEQGPYDVIVLEGSVSHVPEALFAQLAEGGRLVALLRRGAASVANLYVRSGNDVAARPAFNATLPPLVRERVVEKFVF